MKKSDTIINEPETYENFLRDSKRLSDYTIYQYNNYEKLFKKFFEGFGFDGDQESLDKFIRKYGNHSVVRGFVKSYLEYHGIKDELKLPDKPSGSKTQRIVKEISLEQVKILRKCMYDIKEFYGILFDILYYGALRRGEIKNIKINDFNWERFFKEVNEEKENVMCELTIREGKGKKDRVVLIPNSVILIILNSLFKKRIISKLMDDDRIVVVLSQRDSSLFKKPNGKEMDGWTIWAMVGRISERKVGIRIKPHELRHARATELEEKGLSVRVIQHYLGHSAPMTTERYLHSSTKKSLDKVREAMSE